MFKKSFRISTAFLLAVLTLIPAFGQQFVCKIPALAALKPLPKLKYQCNEDLTDSDDEVLTQPNRLKALKLYTKSLEKLAVADWWKTSIEDLNLCDFRRKAGAFSAAEKQKYKDDEYIFRLFGNNQYRIVAATDPCYQQGFNGTNMFLLNRAGGKVFAAEIIDGFFTRADLPLIAAFIKNGSEPLIEIATTSGGMSATTTNYYFTIDKKTNRAVPKNLFKEDGKPTNKITSMMLLDEPEAYGLPPKSEELVIIKNGRLMKSFEVFHYSGESSGDSDHQKFTKTTLRWNGKFYE